jgi:UDP-N-acetylmuramoylalanine--D-glutamate ligase
VTGIDSVAARRSAVWGLGREGSGVVALLRARGAEPVLVDDHPERVAARGGSGGAHVVAPGDLDWDALDVVVRAPGVSRYRDELLVAESAGVEVTTAVALWLTDVADVPVLAVTGTKGKSTTATLAAAVLRAMGRNVELVGNIGVPVTETYDRARPQAYVVEISSYQSVDVRTTPPVCVLTSLAPDHLDWHGGTEAYFRDKLHLLAAGPEGVTGSLAVGAASDEAVRRTAGHPRRILYGPSGAVATDPQGVVRAEGDRLVDTAAWMLAGRPAGPHDRWNLCGAIAGAWLLEGDVPSAAAVDDVVDGFDGLPSRCQVLGQRGGRLFVDDALASNPFATSTSLEAFAGRPVTLIAGGADRGVDLRGLAAALVGRRLPTSLVVVAPDGGLLAEAVDGAGSGRVSVSTAASLEEAVARAEAMTPEGGVVLFSPAQPTPADEGDYRDRSRRFAAAAQPLDPVPPGDPA